MSNPVLENIKSRRVIRELSKKAVEKAKLEQILEAARWAPSGSNHRLNRYVVVQDPTTLRLVRMVSPGMFQRPPLLISICVDWDRVDFHKLSHEQRSIMVDVGTAAQTIMLAAHSLGLASGPVTSFSQEAVRVVLNLPDNLTPEMNICIGYAAKNRQRGMRGWKKITWRDLTFFERFSANDSG